MHQAFFSLFSTRLNSQPYPLSEIPFCPAYCSTADWIRLPTVLTATDCLSVAGMTLLLFRKSLYCSPLIESISDPGIRFNCCLPVRGTVLQEFNTTAMRQIPAARNSRVAI